MPVSALINGLNTHSTFQNTPIRVLCHVSYINFYAQHTHTPHTQTLPCEYEPLPAPCAQVPGCDPEAVLCSVHPQLWGLACGAAGATGPRPGAAHACVAGGRCVGVIGGGVLGGSAEGRGEEVGEVV